MTQQEYTALVDRCKQLSYEYYVLAQPTVSDAQFDALVAEIEQAEAEHPEWTLADSPTQMVGSDVDPKSGRRLIRHRTRMLSCQKAQTQEAVTKWMQTTEKKLKKVGDVHYVLEWKLDGISCSLVYQDGQLVSAATRGDKGIMGQDLLAHVKRMPSVPQTIGMDGRVEVRGEVVCPKANLAALGYKDCRTAAAALCNQATPSRDMSQLEFVAWQLDTTDGIGTETVGIDLAADQGFKTSGYRGCWGEDVLKHLDEFAVRREALEWPTDGVVIKIDCRPLAASLGCTEHHPKGSIAYKFSAQKTVTRVISIEISIGEKGGRTPVAHLEPVMIMGREVSAASLYSERIWHELGVTEGCLVEVGLSNDVTPKIYRVVEPTPMDNGELTMDNEPAANADTEAIVIEAVADQSIEASAIEPEPIEASAPVEENPIETRDEEIARLQARIAELEAQQSHTDTTDVTDIASAVANTEATPIVVVSPRPTERERNAAARQRRREQREAQRHSYEARLAQESAEAEAYARQQERRKIFAAIGAAAVTLTLIYFFGLLGPAVFGLLAGGLLKG